MNRVLLDYMNLNVNFISATTLPKYDIGKKIDLEWWKTLCAFYSLFSGFKKVVDDQQQDLALYICVTFIFSALG